MAIDHYENFPVASILLPRRLRPPVVAIYRFARCADDIADEGNDSPSQRLHALAQYQDALNDIANTGRYQGKQQALNSVFEPLASAIEQYQLPLQPFFDLLSAFEQDVETSRYLDDQTLFDYCRRSANPVGRLMLHLYNAADPDNIEQADAICTGLQLTNFWQDIAIDWEKGRVYIPQDALRNHDLDESFIAQHTQALSPLPRDPRWQALMQRQVAQAREQLRRGIPLALRLPGRIGYELRLVVQGGLHILERLDALHYDVFFQRPVLTRRDWPGLLWRALTMRA